VELLPLGAALLLWWRAGRGVALTPDQIHQLAGITEAILGRLDPDGTMTATYHRYDRDPDPPKVR
jgi:hypothetical protein